MSAKFPVSDSLKRTLHNQRWEGIDGRPMPDWAKLPDEMPDDPTNPPTLPPTLPPQPPPKPEIIRLKFFNELAKPAPKPWLIKGVIAMGETSSWIAPPGKGKSTLLTDIAVHLAAGIDWRGYHTKGARGVVYFALERANLVERRLTAYQLRDKLHDLPIAVAGQVIDLMNKTCVLSMKDAIKRAEDRFGCKVGLGIVDTYSKGIAAGGGDENQAKDQNIAIANLRRIIDQIGIHVATVGHTGKDENKGERGSNAKLADVDVQVQINGDIAKTATVTKANDQSEGELTGFQLEPFDLGADEDGDPFRTFILSKEIIQGVTAATRLSDRQKLALNALANAAADRGKPPPSSFSLPTGLLAVTVTEWRDELYSRGVLDRDAKNPREEFRRIKNALQARSLIAERDAFVWAVTNRGNP
jgi:AAA domain